MKLFFKLFWMGIWNGLENVFAFMALISPIAIGCIAGWLLRKKLSLLLSILCGAATIALGYWILFTIIHAANAAEYCKEHNTDSLTEAWNNTSW